MQKRFGGRIGNLAVVGNAHVFQHAQFLKKPDVLESAGDAQAGDCIRRQADQFPAVQFYASFGGAINAGDQVEDGCLSRTVGADNADKFLRLNTEIAIGYGAKPRKAMGESGYFKERHQRPPFYCARFLKSNGRPAAGKPELLSCP